MRARVVALETTVGDQASAIGALHTIVGHHTNKLQFVSVSGTEMYITGANLNIRNGLGATNGNPASPNSFLASDVVTNGLGNLVLGYIESFGTVTRTGSHNIIVGPSHTYSSVGGLVAGFANIIASAYASVTGGQNNRATDFFSSVSGGSNNSAFEKLLPGLAAVS